MAEADPYVVAILESALEMARAGEVLAVGIAVVGPDEQYRVAYADRDHTTGLNMAVTELAHRVIVARPTDFDADGSPLLKLGR